MVSTTWSAVKSFVDSRKLRIQFLDEGEGSNYLVWAFDGPIHLQCTIDHAEDGEGNKSC